MAGGDYSCKCNNLPIIRSNAPKPYRLCTDFMLTDETVRLILWSSTEMTVTILTATIPTLHPLYKRVFRITSPSQDATPSYKLPDRPPPNDPFYFSPYDNNSQTLVVAGQRNADERSLKSNLSRRDIICTDVVDVEYEQRSDPHTLNHWKTKERSQDWDMV